MNIKRLLIILFILPCFLYGAIDYDVTFQGVNDEALLESLKESSNLVLLQNYAPKTLSALKQRAEADIGNIVNVLHNRALYNAKVSFKLLTETQPVRVEYHIDKGPVYPLASIRISPNEFSLSAKQLGIELNSPATPKTITEAEDVLIAWMNAHGYPYAHLTDKEVTADQRSKSISVHFVLEPGPLASFGETTVDGNCRVLESYIRGKIQWEEGEIFDPEKIACTINKINASGLFSLVQITYPDEPTDAGALPIHIELDEAKHRSIALGLSYSTQRGPGFTVEWGNRNIRGIGNRLFFDANVLQLTQRAMLEYVIPEFRSENQDLIWTLEAEHDDTEGFDETWVSASGRIERKLNPYINYSYGLQYKHLVVTNADTDGTYGLIKAPIHWRWSNANDCLDPTSGMTIYSKLIPTMRLSKDPFFYTIGHFSFSTYLPIDNCRFVLAARAQFGTIFGTNRDEIPASERLYAGSESTLRGYNYWTVSPLDANNDPIGGRSLMVYSLESRWRINENWGAVLFYDAGNVFKEPLPRFDGKMLQSVGVGARYFTPVGPIRMDVAFPLNRRKGVDNSFQFYFSIGQSF
jgi:translocation and assembly module TamA